jgi:hypothetical protein
MPLRKFFVVLAAIQCVEQEGAFMEHHVRREDVEFRQKLMDLLNKSSQTLPAEAFRLMEWVIIIAAVLVADERLNSSWLQLLAFALSMLLVMRVNGFLSEFLKHPEEVQPDGSVLVKFKLWTTLVSLPLAAFAYYIAFGVSALFAESDLAESARTAQVTVAESPSVQRSVAPQVAPKAPHAAAPQSVAKAQPQAAAPQTTAPEATASRPADKAQSPVAVPRVKDKALPQPVTSAKQPERAVGEAHVRRGDGANRGRQSPLPVTEF